MKTVYFITSNEGKLKEAKAKLLGVDIEVVQKNLGYPEIQANALEDVAYFGVKHIQEKFNHPFILEDAGLFIDSLDGFPGVYSAYVFYTVGCSGILKLLDGVDTNKRKACFRSNAMAEFPIVSREIMVLDMIQYLFLMVIPERLLRWIRRRKTAFHTGVYP